MPHHGAQGALQGAGGVHAEHPGHGRKVQRVPRLPRHGRPEGDRAGKGEHGVPVRALRVRPQDVCQHQVDRAAHGALLPV
eukprot:41784-Prorocentrum_minimum.AAC.3